MTNIKLVHRDCLSCEAILRKTPRGDLIIVSQCGGVTEPAIENKVYLFKSVDGGKTWSKPLDIFPVKDKAVYCTEVTVFDGVITAYLTIHNGKFIDYEHIILISRDDGLTWKNYGNIKWFESFVFIRGGIELKSGKRLFAFQNYPKTQDFNRELREKNDFIWKADIDFVENGVLLIDKDNEHNYAISSTVRLPMKYNNRRIWQWSEPTVVELDDNNLVMLLRFTGTGYLWRSNSFDGGLTWAQAYKTDIPNPGNKPKLIRGKQGEIILLNTPNNSTSVDLINRNPLSVWISYDNLKTWGYKKDLIDFEGYLSYPDGIISDDGKRILFSFELNRHDIYFVEHTIEE